MAKTDSASTAASSRPQREKKAPEAMPSANISKKRNLTASKATKKTSTAKAPTKTTASTKKPNAKAPPKNAAAKPAASKKTAAKTATKQEKTKTTANTSRKRKAEDEGDNKPAKKAAPEKKPAKARPVKAPVSQKKRGPAVNEPPRDVFEVLSFGEGTAGELGLGTAGTAVDVKRPRYNPNLAADKVGVVQLSAGGMHAAVLTHDNKILTWGINDNGALGRNTEWDGGLVDADKNAEQNDNNDNSDSDDDNGLNPHECLPAEMDFSAAELHPESRFTKVAAGDTCTLIVTDEGFVYGAGTFRANDGSSQFTPDVEVATRPILIKGLKNIVDVVCGSTHALALDKKGAVYAWGFGEQNQLGRRIVERNKFDCLVPREVGMPRGAKHKIKKIASGPYHCFAITENDELYSWGLNSFGQTGATPESAGEENNCTGVATKVQALAGKKIASIAGGSHHSIAATADGQCFAWGRVDAGQLGIPAKDIEGMEGMVRNSRGQPGLLSVPTLVTKLEGQVVSVSAGPEHSLVTTRDGKAYASGFSVNYQTGLGITDDVEVFTHVIGKAVAERHVLSAHAGSQYGMLAARSNATQ